MVCMEGGFHFSISSCSAFNSIFKIPSALLFKRKTKRLKIRDKRRFKKMSNVLFSKIPKNREQKNNAEKSMANNKKQNEMTPDNLVFTANRIRFVL